MNARVVRFGGKPVGGYSHVKKTERHGITWDSKAEANRYDSLLLLERAGRIRNLQRQVPYRLEVNGILVTTYTADFEYEEYGRGEWLLITEDVKGWPNQRWPMKKKLFLALTGRRIRET